MQTWWPWAIAVQEIPKHQYLVASPAPSPPPPPPPGDHLGFNRFALPGGGEVDHELEVGHRDGAY